VGEHVQALRPAPAPERSSTAPDEACLDLFPAPRQVVTGKQWLLEAVGEIILRGWREATGPCSAAIEATLIQVRPRHAHPSGLRPRWHTATISTQETLGHAEAFEACQASITRRNRMDEAGCRLARLLRQAKRCFPS
jgi:hypothetical protein